MKILIVLLFCAGSAFAKQPLQPVVVDGDNFEWRLISAIPSNFAAGVARSFVTEDFLYLSFESHQPRPILSLNTPDNYNRIELDVSTSSGSIYIGDHSIRFPFFDGVLGIESATKGNTVEARVPTAIFNSSSFTLIASEKATHLNPYKLSQKQTLVPLLRGKLNAILQQESEGELHIRLLEESVNPVNAVRAVMEEDFAKAEELLNQIKDSNQPNLKPWALISLAEVSVWQGDLNRSKHLLREAIKYLDAHPSVAHVQESVRLKMKLKDDPATIISSAGDLSSLSVETRFRIGRLWARVGNNDMASQVFEDIVDEYPGSYHERKAQWTLDNLDDENGHRLYQVYHLVKDQNWIAVALIYKQERDSQSDFLAPLVRMLHSLDKYNQVFTEYLRSEGIY